MVLNYILPLTIENDFAINDHVGRYVHLSRQPAKTKNFNNKITTVNNRTRNVGQLKLPVSIEVKVKSKDSKHAVCGMRRQMRQKLEKHVNIQRCFQISDCNENVNANAYTNARMASGSIHVPIGVNTLANAIA